MGPAGIGLWLWSKLDPDPDPEQAQGKSKDTPPGRSVTTRGDAIWPAGQQQLLWSHFMLAFFPQRPSRTHSGLHLPSLGLRPGSSMNNSRTRSELLQLQEKSWTEITEPQKAEQAAEWIQRQVTGQMLTLIHV